ncbi:PLP-dependent aminotransferase family protein [Nakamurella flavida]|uniref:PLP-dependent aminotransferase family protein n=1 Tax=Nakamurella flavida TaxID=363630 RepID=A0A939C4R5_9ACTN|nr:PLP-dependent aminotransferase family protein [Nakamurella flavida]MBM9475425.1 PLP-dependent aminotransferase family protein [Nakamurella flavida]MBM9475487.1 PLP-dependent aminotransferase family protein [Nakamurella flavida]MDP9777005.1 DNA-binding transcriptional MocR family regulator [Nakamurella flavida]
MNVLEAVGGWSGNPGPLYQRLAQAIAAAVSRGDLTPGTVLPPERGLAASLAVGRSTVVGAYDQLRSQGVLVSRRGSGTWVAGADRDAGASGRGPDGRASAPAALPTAALDTSSVIIDLATARLPTATAVREGVGALGGDLMDHLLERSGYSPMGLPELRTAVADRFTEEGLPTAVDQVLITTGNQQALALLTGLCLGPGDTALVEDPTSPGVLDLLRSMPVTLRSTRSLAGAGADPLIAAIGRNRPALTYLMTAGGPEGRVVRDTDLLHVGSALAGVDGVVVEDTSSRHLALGPLPPYLAARTASEQVVTIGSMSKVFWGGLRVGWIRANERLVQRLARAKVRADLGTPLLSQALSVWLLQRLAQVRDERAAELRAKLAAAAPVLAAHLPGFSWAEPQAGVTLWLRMPHGTSGPFAELARRHGVAVVAGDSLSADGAGDGFVRVCFGLPPAVFAEGVRRLGRAWQDHDRTDRAGGATADESFGVSVSAVRDYGVTLHG